MEFNEKAVSIGQQLFCQPNEAIYEGDKINSIDKGLPV